MIYVWNLCFFVLNCILGADLPASYYTQNRRRIVWSLEKKLKGDPELLLDVCDPLLEEIAEMLTSNFQSFWGSVSQLGKKAEGLDPTVAMKKAIAKGDLFQILAEYVGNKAGLGQLQGLMQAKEEQPTDPNQGLTKL